MDSTKPIAFTIFPIRVVDAIDSESYFDPTQHPNAVQRADECREIVDSGARALIYFSGPLDPEDERAVRTVLAQIRCAALAERARWCAALFIPPGSPVDTDEEIRMAIEPPAVMAGIIHDAKNAEREACVEVAAKTDPDEGDVVDARRKIVCAIRARGQVRPPTVVGITSNGWIVTR